MQRLGAPLTIIHDLAGRRGLVSDLQVSCTNTVCSTEVKISDPRSPKAKALNARSVLGMRNVGRGRNGLVSFCGLMNMLSPVVPSLLRLTTRELPLPSWRAQEFKMAPTASPTLLARTRPESDKRRK